MLTPSESCRPPFPLYPPAFVDSDGRTSLPVVDCRAEVRFEVCCLGDTGPSPTCVAMLMGNDATSIILSCGGDWPKRGNAESSKSDSRSVESTYKPA